MWPSDLPMEADVYRVVERAAPLRATLRGLLREGVPLHEAVRRGSMERLNPIS